MTATPMLFRGGRLFDGDRFHDDLALRVGADGRIAAIGPDLAPEAGEAGGAGADYGDIAVDLTRLHRRRLAVAAELADE